MINEEKDTEIDEAHRWKKLAEEEILIRYPAWRRRGS